MHPSIETTTSLGPWHCQWRPRKALNSRERGAWWVLVAGSHLFFVSSWHRGLKMGSLEDDPFLLGFGLFFSGANMLGNDKWSIWNAFWCIITLASVLKGMFRKTLEISDNGFATKKSWTSREHSIWIPSYPICTHEEDIAFERMSFRCCRPICNLDGPGTPNLFGITAGHSHHVQGHQYVAAHGQVRQFSSTPKKVGETDLCWLPWLIGWDVRHWDVRYILQGYDVG